MAFRTSFENIKDSLETRSIFDTSLEIRTWPVIVLLKNWVWFLFWCLKIISKSFFSKISTCKNFSCLRTRDSISLARDKKYITFKFCEISELSILDKFKRKKFIFWAVFFVGIWQKCTQRVVTFRSHKAHWNYDSTFNLTRRLERTYSAKYLIIMKNIVEIDLFVVRENFW